MGIFYNMSAEYFDAIVSNFVIPDWPMKTDFSE